MSIFTNNDIHTVGCDILAVCQRTALQASTNMLKNIKKIIHVPDSTVTWPWFWQCYLIKTVGFLIYIIYVIYFGRSYLKFSLRKETNHNWPVGMQVVRRFNYMYIMEKSLLCNIPDWLQQRFAKI